MSTFLGSIRKRVFGIAPEETTAARRGFYCSHDTIRERLEKIGRVFASGYNAALQEGSLATLAFELNKVELPFRGFAYEGAAMGLALLDRITPWNRSRIKRFLARHGDPHAYMVHVAIGWVIGRLGGNIEKQLAPLDPMLRWLVVEGYGFHEGFFHWHRYSKGQPVPARLQGYAKRAFNQGLGRCLWFNQGADVSRLRETIASFPKERRSDLWSGLGLSCTYAGEVEDAQLHALSEAAGEYQPQLAQGAAFAAKARQRAGNLLAYTDRACRILCRRPALEAAQWTDEALENLPSSSDPPSFEIWRQRIQARFSQTRQIRP